MRRISNLGEAMADPDEDAAAAKATKFMKSLRKAVDKEGMDPSIVDGWRAVVSMVGGGQVTGYYEDDAGRKYPSRAQALEEIKRVHSRGSRRSESPSQSPPRRTRKRRQRIRAATTGRSRSRPQAQPQRVPPRPRPGPRSGPG